ncbi:Fur family transcriptional regulator [Clostridium grantii]|uniref:Fe2+ or Zn2+ uptake regulation protein n=1 Tax=Clostridium grantii DSM 8605 TaxID=1121316 RepID=A0A1M5QF55_9CLOT|nr:transcriptional repressor [Clostridium grantii]SHH12677.1 Fe2+ or Zn2+ uptake regulation protein [Clostridium grantii DSM 8605]
MDSRVDNVEQIIINSGFKMTYQRRIILNEFYLTSKHMKAEQLYYKVKNKNIGLATVYRTLKIFTDLNIIQEINIDDINYYELKLCINKCIHVHVKCKKCGKIIDIKDAELMDNYLDLSIKLEKLYGIDIMDTNIVIDGVCNLCKEDNHAKTN